MPPKPKTDDVPLSDQLVDEARPATVKPDGSPELIPFVGLRRRARAQFMAAAGPMLNSSGSLSSLDENDTVEVSEAAAILSVVADAEDALRICAKDQPAFDRWALQVDDNTLVSLLSWYVETMQLGEASASST